MTATRFHGVFPYLISPVDENGRVVDRVLTDLVDHLIAAGVHGLTPLGSTGEFAYLSADQKRRVVEVTVAAARGRVPVVAGVAASTTREACRQAAEFTALGVDGVVAILEAYFPLSDDAVYTYFAAIAAATDRPVVLYTNPNFQRVDLSLPVIERLAAIDTIGYIKDASTNTGRLLSIRERVGDRIGIFAASSHIPAAVMLIGGVGWMAGPACLVPRASIRLFNLCRQGAWDEAMALQRRLWRINEVFARYSLAACIKAGLEHLGLAAGPPIPPQVPLDATARAAVATALDGIGDPISTAS